MQHYQKLFLAPGALASLNAAGSDPGHKIITIVGGCKPQGRGLFPAQARKFIFSRSGLLFMEGLLYDPVTY